MIAVMPADALEVDEAHVDLIDKGRSLKSVALTLLGHITPRCAVKFLVDKGHEFVEGSLVSLGPGKEEPGHIVIGVPHESRPQANSWREMVPQGPQEANFEVRQPDYRFGGAPAP